MFLWSVENGGFIEEVVEQQNAVEVQGSKSVVVVMATEETPQQDTADNTPQENMAAVKRGNKTVTENSQGNSSSTDILLMLKSGFDDLVIKHLDGDVREAYRIQKEIDDPREFRAVKAATEKRVLNFLVTHVQKDKVPNIEFFRDVTSILADNYNYIYGSDPMKEVAPGVWVRKFPFRGTGGPSGIRSLPKILQQSFRRLRDVNPSAEFSKVYDSGSLPETKKSRKRKAFVYGVDQSKFYATEKLSKEEFLAMLNTGESSYEEKEELFAANRETVQDILTSSNQIFNSVPGFFDDERHIQHQFQWISEKSIVETIKVQMSPQFEFLHKVLNRWMPTQDFAVKMETAKLKSADLNDNPVPQHVCLLRELNHYWHKKRNGFIRFPDEVEIDSSPHIVCMESKEGIRFNIRAEHKTFLSDLSFSDAVAAFFHLTFVSNMKYPEGGEAVAIWLQRKVAGIVEKG